MNRVARPGQTVLDCIVVEPREWWIGLHRATSPPSRWPGGIYRQDRPPAAVSRAYWKMREALEWSGMPLEPKQLVVDIGSAPGGASQALLERGLRVLGIDPARMDPSLLNHPHFRHIQKRAAAVQRREFRKAQWLVADSNVAPSSALDAIEAIAIHRTVHIRGMLLTLKLLDWELAEEIPQYLTRIRSWGYQYVRARQLAFDRQEICVVALQRRWLRRQHHRARRARVNSSDGR